VRCRSFSQAAAANSVTQSAASQVVLQLEKRLGVKLIDRSTRPWQLTREGQTYYEGCRGLVERYLELEAAVRGWPAQLTPSVQVAAIYSVGLGDMSQFVKRFAELQPGVEVHIDYLHPDKVYEKVQEGAADFGLVSFPRATRELTAIPWREEEMVLVCPRGHRLSKHRTVRLAQLNGEKYVGFDRGLVIRREVDRFLREHGVTVSVMLEFDNIENIKKAIEVGAGVALLPHPTIGREIKHGTLKAVALSHHRFVRPLGIIHRRNQALSGAAKKFVDLLRGRDQMPRRRTKTTKTATGGSRSQHASNGSARTAK
jgi:DNA-binding transcriptional LysR family regulator